MIICKTYIVKLFRLEFQMNFRYFTNFLQVNNNGDVSFNEPFSYYLPEPFPTQWGIPIIAPFWADSDTQCEGAGDVFYRETFTDSIRAKVANEIQSSLFLSSVFYPSSVVIVTWYRIKHFYCFFNFNNKVKTLNCTLLVSLVNHHAQC